MEQLDYDYEIFNAQQSEADKNLAVRFYTTALRNDARSSEEGRPIFEDTSMIEIRVRGDRNNVVQRPVREEDKRRFRGAYEAFEKQAHSGVEGTPLSEWPVLGQSMVEELKYLGFYTVEQLSEANDSVCSKMPGLTTFKQKAQVFLEFSKGAAPLERMQSQIDAQASDIAAANEQLKKMSEALAAAEKKNGILLEKIAAKK